MNFLTDKLINGLLMLSMGAVNLIVPDVFVTPWQNAFDAITIIAMKLKLTKIFRLIITFPP